MCHALLDIPAQSCSTVERERLQEALRWADDKYYDEVADEWTSDLQYSADEANNIAQSLYRHRLIVFSNFLTTIGTVTAFEPNLVDILADAQPGSVLMVLGGKKEPYPEVYAYVDRLAKPAGFELQVAGEQVSSANPVVADRIYAEGVKVYEHLQSLAPDAAVENKEAQRVQLHFTKGRQAATPSQLWAYRKHQWQRTT